MGFETIVKGVMLLGIVLSWEEKVIREIRRFDGVKDAFLVYGEYDGVILFETDGQAKLNAIIARIRRIEGVTRTVTLVASQ